MIDSRAVGTLHNDLMCQVMDYSVRHNMKDITDKVDTCVCMFECESNFILKIQAAPSDEAVNWLINNLLINEVALIPNDYRSAWIFKDYKAIESDFALIHKRDKRHKLVFINEEFNSSMLDRWLTDPHAEECIVCMEDTKEFVLCHVCMNRTCINCYKKILICPYCRCSI